MTNAEDPVRRYRLQFELDLVEEGEGALGADKQPRHVMPAVADAINIVAANSAQHFREPPLDLLGFAAVQSAHLGDELAIALRHRAAIGISWDVARHFTKPCRGAVGEHRVDAAYIVHH